MRTRKDKPASIHEAIRRRLIVPEKANSRDRYPTIGYCLSQQAWYGWNATAFNKFCIGSQVKVGNCAYNQERGAWTAETLEDAKEMAKDFARGVA